jgi:hypothetical protein
VVTFTTVLWGVLWALKNLVSIAAFAISLRIPISFMIMMRRCWASASGQKQLELVPRLDVGARDDGGVKSISLKRASISTVSESSGHCIAFFRVYASIIGRSIGGDPDGEGLSTGISARSIAVQQAFWDGHHRRSCNGALRLLSPDRVDQWLVQTI